MPTTEPSPRKHRTTPRWAVALLMALAALSVVAWIPISRALRTPDERAVVLYQLADLVTKERDAALAAQPIEPADGPGSMRSAATAHAERHTAISTLLADTGPLVPDDLRAEVAAFQALADRQLRFADEADPLTARTLRIEQIRRSYAGLMDELERTASASALAGRASDAWESLILFGLAMVAGVFVVVLFVILQRRNAALEYGAGRRAALEGEQRRLRALIGASHDLIVVIDGEGRIAWASPSVSTFLGIDEADVIGFEPTSLVNPEDLPDMQAAFLDLRTGDEPGPVRVECRIRSAGANDEERWVEIIASNGMGEPGIGGLILTGRDITEQRLATDALETRERELRELMEHVNGVFYRAELAAGPWTFVSPQITRLLGWTPEEWMADPTLWVKSIHPDDRERVLREEDEPTSGVIDYRLVTRSGELRWIRDDASPVQPRGRARPYWVGTLTDVTHAYQVEEELRYQAHHDPLTGLPNRSLLLDRLGNALDRSRRKPTEVGVIFIDLDDFKTVNDELGHAAGDNLLSAVAERLRGAIRPGDTAARLGGDEFALLVDEVERDGLEQVADRVMAALDEPITLGTRQIQVAASAGVSMSTGSATDPERMLRDADTAMYVAKRQGKNRWVLFDPGMSGPIRQRVRMEGDLRRALGREEFQLVYQPVVRLADGRIEGAEALLRWHSPDLGPVDPREFLEIAEDSGLMPQIGAWVLERACQDAAMWQRYSRRGIWLGVNISARQLLDPGMVGSVTRALREAELDAGHLMLEVNESAALRDLDAVEARLLELHETGVRLAIDDFGSGTSSIGHLRRLDFDVIKLDRTLIADIHRSAEAQDLVRSIVHISRTVHATPLAEGVEVPEQVAALRAAGCELAQGYLFARPMDALLLRDTFLPRNLGAAAG
jgi:diguanylate cyclase (GGDEF)-like protein/PAS domain S-box-containing protein